MKESVQKMNGRKKYKGELYSFFRNEKSIGSGGNGAVYEVDLDDVENVKFPVVAKFLSMKGEIKKKDIIGLKRR